MAASIQWEYHVEKFSNWRGIKTEDVEAALNAMGVDGWEVVNLVSSPEGAIWVTAKRILTSAVTRARITEAARQ